ncbi:RxLR effector protein [Phytophthora megakarya]|uniref:RxLR effector protein n=1 Tax=Phytophthora megakarya TaxID=4795 RepID=A0A225VSK3_9STRA|nr:RxLR effector protein [Phytophthora megakarya]
MRPYQVLLVTVVIVLVSNVYTAATEPKLAPTDIHSRTRSLRIIKSSERIDASSTEERAVLSTLRNKFNDLGNEFKVIRWATSGKSDNYVLNKLGLKGLSGTALKTHKNYKIYESFLDNVIKHQLTKWVTEGRSTSTVWGILGLDKVPVKNLVTTKEFVVYFRYVKLFDSEAMRNWGLSKLPEMVGLSKTEMTVKSRIWAQTRTGAKTTKEAKHIDAYVKMALELEGLSDRAIKKSSNYIYYKSYLDEIEALNKISLRKGTR